MDIIELPGGEIFRRNDKAVIVELHKPCRILSTSYLNGGCREDIDYLFNYCEVYDSPDDRCEMRAATNREHLSLIAEELGLPPLISSGLSTAATMKYAFPQTEYFADFSVTAFATAGIDVNGSRAGDPAFWHEIAGVPVHIEPGTINIFLFINASLDAGALSKALVTCTEAKTAALQELLAPSCMSSGLATGSGTDGVIIVSNTASSTLLTDAGQHSKLGELIGRVSKKIVKEAMVVNSGFRNYACGSVLKRMKRYGLDEEKIYLLRQALNIQGIDMHEAFKEKLDEIDVDDRYIAIATTYVHLLDLFKWELVKDQEVVRLAKLLLDELARIAEKDLPGLQKYHQSNNNVIECLIEAFALNWAFIAKP